jgi:putative glutamine amidotransferase
MQRPLIGILLDSEARGSFSGRPYYALRCDYFAAIERAGGLPIGLPYTTCLPEMLSRIDGVLVPGGDYRFPAEWYEDGAPSAYGPNEARLKAETALIQTCLETGKPMLAICCGMQVMAATQGGKLRAKLATEPINHRTEGGAYAARHAVRIAPDSLLHNLTGAEELLVNTHHQEGVVQLGAAIRAVATAPDGVIEAIEVVNHPFALGLQWHPEIMLDDPVSEAIFRGLVGAGRK